jgi:hypothetical protein
MQQKRRSFGHAAMLGAFVAVLAAAFLIDWAEAQAQQAKKKAAPNVVPKVKVSSLPKTGGRAIPGAGKKLDALQLARIIDQEIDAKLKEEGIKPSPVSDDAEFLRRVYLDIVGVIPTADKAQAFLDDKSPNKRQQVIDELLNDSRFGRFHAELISGLLIPRESNNRRLSSAPFQNWLADKLNKNQPLDKTVYELITATGDQDQNGAVTFYVGNPTVDKMTDNVSRMFLGVQLQCAQCHNHPFTEWKQKEYWGMAQFFMKVRLTANPNQAAKKGMAPGIIESAKAGKKGQLPESAMIVPAKFLGAEEVKLKDSDPFRPVLAEWIVSQKNPYFAKAMVNRFWYQMFGRGIVNPVDDMHENNDPSHPELLAALTEQFKASGHDLKYLIRAMCNSSAYQRTSRPSNGNDDDVKYYSHRLTRVVIPEQLYDSIATIVGPEGRNQGRPNAAAKKGQPAGGRDGFISFFRVEDGFDPLEYQNGIPQALRLMNSNQTNLTRAVVDNAMQKAGNEPSKVIERLYLTILSRRPTADETTKLLAYLQKTSGAPSMAYGDMVWVLMNSSEFMVNH